MPVCVPFCMQIDRLSRYGWDQFAISRHRPRRGNRSDPHALPLGRCAAWPERRCIGRRPRPCAPSARSRPGASPSACRWRSCLCIPGQSLSRGCRVLLRKLDKFFERRNSRTGAHDDHKRGLGQRRYGYKVTRMVSRQRFVQRWHHRIGRIRNDQSVAVGRGLGSCVVADPATRGERIDDPDWLARKLCCGSCDYRQQYEHSSNSEDVHAIFLFDTFRKYLSV